MLLTCPLEGEASLTIVLAVLFAAEGLCQITTAIAYRKVITFSWIWMLASGIIDVAMVAIMVAFWPISDVWMIGVFVSVNLTMSGAAIVTAALAVRAFAKIGTPEPVPAS